MDGKFKIAVLGIGGVGGYIGGKLAGCYFNSTDKEIIFIARGENQQQIKSLGLKLVTDEGEQIVHPPSVKSTPSPQDSFDLVICTVKSYDLQRSIELWKTVFSENTVIIPFLNGVDARDRIKKILPIADVWNGCIYIVSRLISPGTVKVTGSLSKAYFGSDSASKEKLKMIENIFKNAGINAQLSQNIDFEVWRKFFFISPLATITSFLDTPVGGIINHIEKRKLLRNLLEELKIVADAIGITFEDSIIEKTLSRFEALPQETTSSMHDDFKKGKKTELNSLTGYVVSLAEKLNAEVPTYKRMFTELNNKAQK
ncbi:MAG: ketopantoate reductase family protein [Chlorobi bacterium]|nr:ketopantoate reductase family protein [Chlorobiota bacterium]MCI0716447.1 ketopantoate reductase family protein [Chlorobiota bacterium]